MHKGDIVFKMILIGDEGLLRNKILEQLGIIATEDAIRENIGNDIYKFSRNVDDVNVTLILHDISLDPKFQQLRKAYYMNASMVVLYIEEYDQHFHSKFEQIVDEVFSITGKIPIAIVSNTTEKTSEVPAIFELATKLDASQLILDLNNLTQLEEKIERLLRETLFNTENGKAPYILQVLRLYGLSAANRLDRDAIIEAIRNDDSLSRLHNIVTSDELHSHLESQRSSLFIDLEQLKQTEHSIHIPEILKNRASEIREIWVNKTLSGKYDLRYLWLTAYGFEILRALKVKEIAGPSEFEQVRNTFSKLGFELQVRDDNIYPKSEMTDELKSFVWDLVKNLKCANEK